MILNFQQWLNESFLSGGRSPLYHATTFYSLTSILNTNAIVGNPDDNDTISCSRSLDYVFLDHPVVIALDAEKLRVHHHVHPFDWAGVNRNSYHPKSDPHRPLDFEDEDRVDGDIYPLDKYVVEILMYERPLKTPQTVNMRNLISAIEKYLVKYPHVKFKTYDSDRRVTKSYQLPLAVESLMELKNVTINGDTDKPYNVLWHNGDIIVNPEFEDRAKYFYSVNMLIDVSTKTVKLYPGDDFSDMKQIKKIQQALSDCKNAKLIDDEWSVLISDEDLVAKSTGSAKLSDFLKFDTNFDRTIPRCFHGTSSDKAEDILRNGLWPKNNKKSNKKNWTKGYTEHSDSNVYLTIDYNRAEYYAEIAVNAAEKRGLRNVEPVVFEIKNLPVAFIVSDDDYETGVGMSIMQALRGVNPSIKNYIKSIRNSGQFGYRGHIPASMLSIVKQ